MLSKVKIFVFISYLILGVACSHIQKTGELIHEKDLDVELNTFEKIDLSDKKKFDQFLKTVKQELSLVKKQDDILPATWNKIGQLLEIYKGITQNISQNQILVPFKTELSLNLDSFCMDPSRARPHSTEIFQWIYGNSSIPLYEKILKYYQGKNNTYKNLIQELIWNLSHKTYYENYPQNLKRILNEIDPNAFLKIPSRTRREIIEEGVSVLEKATGIDIRGAEELIRGKYYSLQEFKAALEGLESSYVLPEQQFYSRIPETHIFTTSHSQSYQHQVFNFYNPSDETQMLDLGHYYLKPFRLDVQRIALTASFGDMDYFKKELDKFFREILSSLGVLYPMLTDEEKRLIEKYPYESLQVFWHKSRAEFASKMVFGDKGSEDGEADAFRHFVWAGFLTHDLGKILANRFLNAHESEDFSDSPERKMDEHNNKNGIEAALRLDRENRFTAEHLYGLALGALKKEQLIVIRPRGNIPDASY